MVVGPALPTFEPKVRLHAARDSIQAVPDALTDAETRAAPLLVTEWDDDTQPASAMQHPQPMKTSVTMHVMRPSLRGILIDTSFRSIAISRPLDVCADAAVAGSSAFFARVGCEC